MSEYTGWLGCASVLSNELPVYQPLTLNEEIHTIKKWSEILLLLLVCVRMLLVCISCCHVSRHSTL